MFSTNITGPKEEMGKKMKCIVCNESINWECDFVEHHITYFPERTITIHRKCHSRKKLSPLGLIQYSRAEYHFFYEDLSYLKYSLPLPTLYFKPIKSRFSTSKLVSRERIMYCKLNTLN